VLRERLIESTEDERDTGVKGATKRVGEHKRKLKTELTRELEAEAELDAAKRAYVAAVMRYNASNPDGPLLHITGGPRGVPAAAGAADDTPDPLPHTQAHVDAATRTYTLCLINVDILTLLHHARVIATDPAPGAGQNVVALADIPNTNPPAARVGSQGIRVYSGAQGRLTVERKHRKSDVVCAGEWDALKYGYAARDWEFAQRYVSAVSKIPGHISGMKDAFPMSALILAVNVMSRDTFGGHNWISGRAGSRNSPQSSMVKVAGGMVASFRTVVEDIGHSIFHWIPTPELTVMADAVTGVIPVAIPGGLEYAGTVVPSGGVKLTTLLGLPAGMGERYPLGVSGLSAIIIGLGYFRDLVATASVKLTEKVESKNPADVDPDTNRPKMVEVAVDLTGSRATIQAPNDVKHLEDAGSHLHAATNALTVGNVQGAIGAMIAFIGRIKWTRAQLIILRSHLYPICAHGIGYMQATASGREQVDSHKSLEPVILRNATEVSIGKVIGQYLESKQVSDLVAIRTITSALSSAVSGIAAMFNSVSIADLTVAAAPREYETM
jgi:hypothetical protein